MRIMVNPFQLIAERMAEIGFYDFLLPWMITAAVFWGLLKRSNLFESPGVNAIVALAASFFLWGYVIGVASINVGGVMSTFMTQLSLILVAFLFVVVGATMFYPSIGDLYESVKGSQWIIMSLVIGILLVVLSGMLGPVFSRLQFTGRSGDVMVIVLGISLFVMLIIVAAAQG